MPRKPTGMPNGRPPCDGHTPKEKERFKAQFEGLCRIQCTEEEICGVLSCDEATLNRWCKETYGVGFAQIYKEKRQGGKASLRRQQFKIAETNATMAIWLGKQYLGQTDEQTVRVDMEDLKPLSEMLGFNDDEPNSDD